SRFFVSGSLFDFYFSSRRRHTRSKRDWSSDVCSSDLELRNIGVRNQMLIINGLLQSHMQDDKVSIAFYERQQYALNKMPEELKQLKTYSLPYVSYSLTGIDNLRKLISNNPFVETEE